MKPFFSYFGSKYIAARKYPAPEHQTVIEPFAGSACYSTYWNVRHAILLDKSEYVANIWRYLLSSSPDDILSLPDLQPGIKISDTAGIPEDARALVGSWCNTATSSQRNVLSKWAKNSKSQLYWSSKVRDRIASQIGRISGWEFFNADYKASPDIEATWFIDPPYRGKPGSNYPNGSSEIDYTELGEWCMTKKGLVIVCEGPQHGNWLPFTKAGDFHAMTKPKRSRTSVEFVWIRWTTPPKQGRLF